MLVAVAGLDDHADAGGRPGPRVDDADLVVCQAHRRQVRVGGVQGLAQGAVEGVDRAVALSHGVLPCAVDAQFHRGLGHGRPVVVLLDGHGVVVEVEERLGEAGQPPHKQGERRLGRLEVVPQVLQALDLFQHLLLERLVGCERRAGQFREDRAAARKFADQDPPRVSHQGRVNVLVGPLVAGHRRHVHAALVGERARPDVRLAGHHQHVGDVVDEARNVRQMGQALAAQALAAHLQFQVRQQDAQVRVAAPFPQPVDGALHLGASGADGGQGVRHGQTGVVVAVDAQRAADPGRGGLDDGGDLLRQAPAVRIAQDEPVGPGLPRRRQHGQGVLGVGLVAVEVVLGVEEDRPAGLLGQADRVADHRQVLVQVGPQDRANVEVPGLAHQGHGLGAGVEHAAEAGVVLGRCADPPGHPERHRPGMGERLAREFPKDRLVLRIAGGVPRLDVIDAQVVEAAGDVDLVLEAEVHALALRAVPQRRIVHGDACHGLCLVWPDGPPADLFSAAFGPVARQKDPEPFGPGSRWRCA